MLPRIPAPLGTLFANEANPRSTRFLLFQYYVDGLNDFLFWIGLAVNNHIVNARLCSGNVQGVLFAKTVVPAAVPDPKEVGVLLERPGKLSARQFLDVDVSALVGISVQF